MGPAVLDTSNESVCYTLHCEISALEDFNVGSVSCWPSQVTRITGTPCTEGNTTSHCCSTPIHECEQHTHTCTDGHTHTLSGMAITVSVPVPLLTLSCRLLNVHEYCPASLEATTEMNRQAVRWLTWYLEVLEMSSGAPLYIHCTVG